MKVVTPGNKMPATRAGRMTANLIGLAMKAQREELHSVCAVQRTRCTAIP